MTTHSTEDLRLATLSHIGYLLNITVLPLFGFILQVILWQKTRCRPGGFAHQHAQQSLIGSILAGFFLACMAGLIILIGGIHSPWTWVLVILYVTLCHSFLILLGVLACSRANAGKAFFFLKPKSWWN